MTKREVVSRDKHPYATERVTPLSEIPKRYRKRVPLQGGGWQIIDTRLNYNAEYNPVTGKWRYVECSSVNADAEAGKGGFSKVR